MSRALKNDAKDMKPELQYIDPQTLYQLAYAMMSGAIKYAPYNYLLGHKETQLLSAAIRHLFARMSGEYLDKDCTERLGHPVTHLGCAMANINMLIAQAEAGTLEEDAIISQERLCKLKGDTDVD